MTLHNPVGSFPSYTQPSIQ